MEDNKKPWIPTDFMKLILSYEQDESKFEEISEKLDSKERKDYLYGVDNTNNGPLLLSIIFDLKIKKYLFEKIKPEDNISCYKLLVGAIIKCDYEITKFILDNYLSSLNQPYGNYWPELFILALTCKSTKIIELFLDMYQKYSIFYILWNDHDTIYQGIYTQLEPIQRDTVLGILFRHKYYGPILLGDTQDNFSMIIDNLPELIGDKIISKDQLNEIVNTELRKPNSITE